MVPEAGPPVPYREPVCFAQGRLREPDPPADRGAPYFLTASVSEPDPVVTVMHVPVEVTA